MDWQEELKKVGIVGISGFLGHIFLKYGKKSIHPIKKIFRNADKVDKVITDSHYNHELIKAIMQLLPSPIYLMDLQGSMECANKAWCDVTEFRDPEDAHGNGWLRAIPDEELDRMRKRNDDFVKHPSNIEGTQMMMGIYSKKPFKVHFKTVLLDDENQKPFKVLGILEIIKP